MPAERKKLKKNIKKKRTHFQYTEEALAKAVQAIRIENKSIRETCRLFGVPRSTIQDRISGRTKEQPRKVGPEPILGLDGEKKVVDWIIDLAKCGIPVSKEVLLETVTKLIKDIGKEDKFPEGRPGQTWYQGFLRRHPEISLREPESINKARESVKESSIRKWFTELEYFLTERGMTDIMKDSDRILNGDETGISLCPKSGKVLAPRGYKNVYVVKKGNEKETLTVLVMMTASGKVCPPLVVFPYIRPPKAVVENMPEGWIIGKSESGWMRSDVFYEYIANDFNDWLVKNNIKKPVILFVDGHRSHMSMALSLFCDENGIVLYALPPNTTHIMQPADVSVFKPLKQEWKKTLRNWQVKPENLNKTVTKTNFCKVFKETLDLDMTQSIKNGFRKCGLFPFDVEAVDFTKCVKDFQERRKKRSLSSGGLTERDYVSAIKVVVSIKENLLKRGIDPDIVCSEIELSKSSFSKNRRSTSKTPRNSTEVVNSSAFKTPKQIDDYDNMIRTANVNTTRGDGVNLDYSLLDDISIPDVGAYVSLSDISILKIADINIEDLNASQITLEEIPQDDKDDDLAQGLLPLQSDCVASTSKIITVAEVHTRQSPSSPKNAINDNSNAVNPVNDILLSTSCMLQNNKQNDPFKNHLRFPISPTGILTTKRNINKFPSAISSEAWRDFHDIKEKEKQNKIDEKNKRKVEREQKKCEPKPKKQKIVNKNKNSLNISKNKQTKDENVINKEQTTDENVKNIDQGVEINTEKTDKVINETDKYIIMTDFENNKEINKENENRVIYEEEDVDHELDIFP